MGSPRRVAVILKAGEVKKMINEAASRGAEEAARKLQAEPGASADTAGTVAYWGLANEYVKQRRAVSAFDKYKPTPTNLKGG